MRSRPLPTALTYAALIILALIFLLPFWVILRNAFSTSQWITAAEWHWLPNAVGFGNLAELLGNTSVPLVRSMINSAVVSVLQTVATVIISALAGYGLAIDNRISKILLGVTVATLMVPAAVTFVPTFVMVSSLGWISTLRGLIIPGMFSALATFLFRQYFLAFPRELEEAAYLDGAGYWRTFWRIVVPNSYGIGAAVGTLIFIGSWNAFLWPLLIGQDPDYRTVQLALSGFLTSQRVDYPQLFTGAVVAILPVLLVFLFLQRYLIQGVERSGID
ncbi:carbohydrate ABC transporter permease [Microlunatus speluncae]|uniref:carbohydrate ABC transporter permease n=1 Tax=Microlunatus speluncae TaxID=2594267 RepID=UPI001266462D|nr:carbohydrate ABC transporter permease [Microlunatus speluncae]